jgi:hypothetical protein
VSEVPSYRALSRWRAGAESSPLLRLAWYGAWAWVVLLTLFRE